MDTEGLSFETQSLRAKLDAVRKEVEGLHHGKTLPLPVLRRLRDMVDPEKHGRCPQAYELSWELDHEIERLTQGARYGTDRA